MTRGSVRPNLELRKPFTRTDTGGDLRWDAICMVWIRRERIGLGARSRDTIMKLLIAGKPLLIAGVSLSALCGGCARNAAPPRTAVVENATRPIPSAPRAAARDRTSTVGVTERQAEAPPAALSEPTATIDLSGVRGDEVSGMTKEDADVAQSVRHALLGDALLENCPAIHVSISNGKVTLQGAVGSALAHLSAVTDVVRLHGVVEVDDQISEEQAPQATEAGVAR